MTDTIRKRVRDVIFDALLSTPPLDVREASRDLDRRVDAILDVLAEPSDGLIEAGGAAANDACGCLSYHHGRKVAASVLRVMLAAIRDGK